jgi:hypothetical protein
MAKKTKRSNPKQIERDKKLQYKNYRTLLSTFSLEKWLKEIRYLNIKHSEGPFRILCQSGKITNTQGHRYEDRNRRRAICSRY